MSKNDARRQRIFDKYSQHIDFLIDRKILKGYKKGIYICPICLEPHIDLNSADPLTLEDVPPKSLGGRQILLTCKTCNNEFGSDVEGDFVEMLRLFDNREFIPGTEFPVIVRVENETLRGRVTVNENKEMIMTHLDKNNNPKVLNATMANLKEGDIIDFDFQTSNIIPENFGIALLKTAYLLAFEKFGWSLMLDDCYDVIREQILNPGELVYPGGFWGTPSKDHPDGVHFMLDRGLECLYVVFTLNTGNRFVRYSVFLPLRTGKIDLVLGRINALLAKYGSIQLTIYPDPRGPGEDYLLNLKSIQKMNLWIAKRH